MTLQTEVTEERKMELLRKFDKKVKRYFVETCKAKGVKSFGVCGIDPSDSGELVKMAIRMEAAVSYSNK